MYRIYDIELNTYNVYIHIYYHIYMPIGMPSYAREEPTLVGGAYPSGRSLS